MLTHYGYFMELINRKLSLEEIFKKYPGNSNEEKKMGEEVLVTREHVISILNRYLVGELSAEDVESWAETVFFTEGISRENGYFEIVSETLMYLLQEPGCGNPLTKEKAIELIKNLNDAVFDHNEVSVEDIINASKTKK